MKKQHQHILIIVLQLAFLVWSVYDRQMIVVAINMGLLGYTAMSYYKVYGKKK